MNTASARAAAFVERGRARRSRRAAARARAPQAPASPNAGGTSRRTLVRRLLHTVVLACVYVVLEVGAKAIVICQLLWVLARGKPHPWLTARGAETALYLHGMWAYLSCAKDRAPWPFAPWPSARERAEPSRSRAPATEPSPFRGTRLW